MSPIFICRVQTERDDDGTLHPGHHCARGLVRVMTALSIALSVKGQRRGTAPWPPLRQRSRPCYDCFVYSSVGYGMRHITSKQEETRSDTVHRHYLSDLYSRATTVIARGSKSGWTHLNGQR